MTYAQALRWLYSFTNYEMVPLSAASAARLDLQALRSLLARLGDPQRGRHSVHITGSKGKGSTAAMMETILRGAGQRTGLFTSPHIHRETERIQIDGQPLDPGTFVRLVEQIQPHVEAIHPEVGRLTTFDLRTALAFLAFREQEVTWQVMEVGLGGRLDSTNVLDEKALCIFTPVSLEHTQVLGNTVAEIAGDKSGILRRDSRAVMAPQRESAADVFRARCAELEVPLEEVATACALSIDRADADGQNIRLRTPRATYRFRLPLIGRHQAENAATAVLGVENLAESGLTVDPGVVATSLGEVRWPGRLEVVKQRPLVVLDGAHNTDSARRLVQALRETFSPRRTLLVVGLNADKDIVGFAAALCGGLPSVDVIATRAAIGRAAEPAAVAEAFVEAGAMVRTAPAVSAAVEEALAEAEPGDLVCVTGSLYVVAEARAWLLGILPDGIETTEPSSATGERSA
ncbi:MAG: bifunctional folylpolyglutamate synthase/dihydrofolate synthase [Dehalococcoidia bacterium]